MVLSINLRSLLTGHSIWRSPVLAAKPPKCDALLIFPALCLDLLHELLTDREFHSFSQGLGSAPDLELNS